MKHNLVLALFSMSFLLIASLLTPAYLMGAPASEAVDEVDEFDEWLRDAQLGPYAPEVEDWDEVRARAANEPPLRVVMTTSRYPMPVRSFNEAYPGIPDVEGVYIRSGDAYERLTREWDAGVFDYGFIHFVDPSPYHGTIDERMFVNYLPPELRDRIPEELQEPFVTYRTINQGWGYNPVTTPADPPFENIWELTTERFRGNVILMDPMLITEARDQFLWAIRHPDKMEAAYKDFFGEELELEYGENAGWEWYIRLLQNDPMTTGDQRARAEALHNAREGELLVAAIDFDRLRWTHGEPYYDMTMVKNTNPIDGVVHPAAVAIGGRTRSPNAAKLFTKWMYTDEGGEAWFAAGNPPPMVDWEAPVEWINEVTTMNWGLVDVDFIQENMDRLFDKWFLYLGD